MRSDILQVNHIDHFIGIQAAARTARIINGNEIIISPILEIRYLEAEGKNTRIVLRDQEGILHSGLSIVWSQLPADHFVQIHRSVVVNMGQARKVMRDDLGRLVLFMQGRNEKLMISRPYEHLFRSGIS